MLMGTYQHNIDSKGRVIMPAKFREELGSVFYITRGLDNCLSVLSKSDWDSLGEKLRSLPSSQTKDIQRFLFSGAAELEPDKQGRVLIPQPLRDYAGLTKDVVIIGTGLKAEIWDFDRWNEYNNKVTEDSMFDIMSSLGI
ncbi:MAG: division/cell wall cluster transcriptional repressor MraZ [Candidatus Pseudoruminococcus sp.]|uniref:division/cell wall cluster transcriptional repressor MraZ n=1 Tax=Candidatus Pseudoruminococcus sp. TaxID=3101048 RepID=UPI002A7B373E|nr:division/cell wall cluster transcriptional repressor MraZ [Ruminococcus sp.]MDY2783206.1 division/cell wall cluster transcriptional repressor MraZ [Candidatus Pseudoruminococcus sp.]